jgi:hypothetical protein
MYNTMNFVIGFLLENRLIVPEPRGALQSRWSKMGRFWGRGVTL